MAPCTTQGTGLATYSTWCKSCGAPNYVEFGACHAPYVVHGGERGIRTLGPDFVGTHDFQSCPFSLSGISPTQSISSLNQLYLIPLTYRLSPRERDVLAHFVRSASLRSPNPRSRFCRNTRFPIVPLQPLGHLSDSIYLISKSTLSNPSDLSAFAEREGCTRSLRSLRLPSVAEPASANAGGSSSYIHFALHTKCMACQPKL
jgi:hypothetical protein